MSSVSFIRYNEKFFVKIEEFLRFEFYLIAKHIKHQFKLEYAEASLVRVDINGQTRICLMEELCGNAFSRYSNFSYVPLNPNLNDNEKLLVDFSHWSHWWTAGNLMVVNLHGWWHGQNVCRLTNPAVRSRSCAFGKTDSGSNGFLRYFLSHRQMCCSRG